MTATGDDVVRAQRGDRDAFRRLFVRHRQDVLRLVHRMLGPSGDAEDVAQEVFVQVHKSLADFRAEAKFTTWLHRVTVNVVLMHRRAKRSRPNLTDEISEEMLPDASRFGPDDEFARRERIRAFFRLLDQLADKKRTVFVLHELEGMTPQEIAAVVGAPVLTVRTRLFYARRELDALIAEDRVLSKLLESDSPPSAAADSAADSDGGSR